MSWMAAVLGLPPGDTHLLVGVERGPDDVLIYLDARYTGLHTHAPAGEDPRLDHMADHGFQPHIFIDVPASALCRCEAATTPTEGASCRPSS